MYIVHCCFSFRVVVDTGGQFAGLRVEIQPLDRMNAKSISSGSYTAFQELRIYCQDTLIELLV